MICPPDVLCEMCANKVTWLTRQQARQLCKERGVGAREIRTMRLGERIAEDAVILLVNYSLRETGIRAERKRYAA
jgi:hypothetical protein